MAGRYGIKKPPGSGRDFKVGNPGGPGRPPVPIELKEARKLNQVELELIMNKLMGLNVKELEDIKSASDTTAIVAMIASIMIVALKTGDQTRLDFLLNRLIGKVKEKVEHSGTMTLEALVLGDGK